jgi:hypothetical protein
MKFVFILINLLQYVYCFGFKTHKYLGNYLDVYLNKSNPQLYYNILDTLQGHTIHDISIWADKMKKKKGYTWTKTLHYVDITDCNNTITNKILDYYCQGKCIVSAITDFVDAFKNYKSVINQGNLNKNELLKFIIHFIQDFNQPMHLLGYDAGGNGFDVITKQHSGRNKSSNVHYLWDTLIPEFYIKHYNFTYTERSKVIPEIKTQNELSKLLLQILNINLQIGCKVYPKSNYIIFDEYFNHKDMQLLFNNYITMSIQIFAYLFDNNKILQFQI